MNLVIDIRERSLIQSCEKLKRLDNFKDIIISTENLDIGDIVIRKTDKKENKKEVDILIIERKTVNDLLSSIKDGRYSEQSYRLNGIEHENHNIIYLIEGTLRNLGNEMQMAYSSIFSINYYKGFSIFRSENIDETVYILMNMCLKLKKEKNKLPYYPKEVIIEEVEVVEGENKTYKIENETESTEGSDKNYCSFIKKKKNANITPDNFGEIVLCQIPTISSVTAIAIMKEFETLNNLIEKLRENEDCLNEIKTETSKGQKRKISKTSIKNIIEYLLK
jgi:ERCC4-type nuclease